LWQLSEDKASLLVFIDHGFAQLSDGSGLPVGETSCMFLFKQVDDFIQVQIHLYCGSFRI